MNRFSKIEFDQVDGYLEILIDKGNVFLHTHNTYTGTHLIGRIFSKELKDIKGTQEGSIFLECDNNITEEISLINPKGDAKKLKEVIFIHYNEANGFCGFIFLGEERKLVIEIGPEDYIDFITFLNKTL